MSIDNFSLYFKRKEFECQCRCGFDTVDVELIMILDDLRRYFGKPIHINSGCRCEKHNKEVGGEPGSYHLKARAADIVVQGIDPKVVHMYLEAKYPDKYGFGLYSNRNHVDSRSTKARWLK